MREPRTKDSKQGMPSVTMAAINLNGVKGNEGDGLRNERQFFGKHKVMRLIKFPHHKSDIKVQGQWTMRCCVSVESEGKKSKRKQAAGA